MAFWAGTPFWFFWSRGFRWFIVRKCWLFTRPAVCGLGGGCCRCVSKFGVWWLSRVVPWRIWVFLFIFVFAPVSDPASTLRLGSCRCAAGRWRSTFDSRVFFRFKAKCCVFPSSASAVLWARRNLKAKFFLNCPWSSWFSEYCTFPSKKEPADLLSVHSAGFWAVFWTISSLSGTLQACSAFLFF